jgi:hypothetical protein
MRSSFAFSRERGHHRISARRKRRRNDDRCTPTDPKGGDHEHARTTIGWRIDALPPGLQVIRASNGNRIEGTPTARGIFTFNLTVRDQDGQQATQVTSITIN